MGKILIFIIVFVFTIKAYSQDINLEKKISINIKNASPTEVFQEISNKTNIDFSYNSELLKDIKRKDFKLKNKSIKHILRKIKYQYKLSYEIVENQLIIKKFKQKKYTISGFIKDQEKGENLIGATVLVSGTRIGTITNSYGFFSLTLPEDIYNIEFSYIGYTKNTQQIILDKNIKLNMDLKYNNQIINQVDVQNNKNLESIENPQMGILKPNIRTISKIPKFMGETGLIQTLQTMPGIKSFSDVSSYFFVRGGNKDQNLILIDEAPIYNPTHLFGFYSIIVPDVIKDIKIYKSDFPVSFDDRLSSVIDIKTKDGNKNKFSVKGALNPLVNRISLEGPISKNKSSFYISYRHSNFSWLYKKSAPELSLYFYDFNTKFNLKISKKDRLYYSLYYGRDNLSNGTNSVSVFSIYWHNIASTLRWNHIFSDKLFSNTTIYGSVYNYNLKFEGGNTFAWNSKIANLTIKTDLTHYISSKNTLSYGFSQNFHNFNPGNLVIDSVANIPKVESVNSRETCLYINNKYKINNLITYNVGLRLTNWRNYGPTKIYTFNDDYQVKDTIDIDTNKLASSFINIDPRLSLNFKIDSLSSIKVSYGVYHQYIQLLSNSTSPFTSLDVWLPSGTNLLPQSCQQYSLGYIKLFSQLNLSFTTEVYYKKMKNQIDYESHANMLLNPLIEGEIRQGSANSYGVEFFIKRSKGRYTGWINYTYSRIFKTTEGINNNNPYPAYYDRPHDLSIFFSYLLTKQITASFNWMFYTGSAITTPIGFYYYNNTQVPFYGEINNDRLPNYHRLDLSIDYKLNKKKQRFNHNLILSIFNVYNRKNPIAINFNKVKTQNGNYVIPADVYGTNNLVVTEKYLLGIMPSLTYKFRF